MPSLRRSGAAKGSLASAGTALVLAGWLALDLVTVVDCARKEESILKPIETKVAKLTAIDRLASAGREAAVSRQSFTCSSGTLCNVCEGYEPLCCEGSETCVPGQGCVPQFFYGCAENACGTGNLRYCATPDAYTCPGDSRKCVYCDTNEPQCCTGDDVCTPSKGCVPPGWTACVDSACTTRARRTIFYYVCEKGCCGDDCCESNSRARSNPDPIEKPTSSGGEDATLSDVGGGGGDCYGPGERNEGADGFPDVYFKPCCDGQTSLGKEGDWGKFCPSACAGPGERNQGAEGFPGVEYKPCCDGRESVGKEGDWGKFCPGGGDCAGPGERTEGAEGFPQVDYKPCCDGQASVGKAGDWGKFCP